MQHFFKNLINVKIDYVSVISYYNIILYDTCNLIKTNNNHNLLKNIISKRRE